MVSNTNKKIKKITRSKSRLIFCCLILALPVLQFSIFYFYVNFNSLILAFEKYEIINNKLIGTFVGFDNFSNGISIILSNLSLIKNSVVFYFIHLIFGTFLGTIFAYYIYKNYFMSNFFKVLLFVPNIIATIILATIYRYLCEDGYPIIAGWFGKTDALGLISNEKTVYWTIVFFNIFISFGSTVLLMSGSMSGINEAIIESAQMDGVNVIQEFVRIIIPMIFPTVVTFIITGLSGVFINQMSVLSFYGTAATPPEAVLTFGYRFLVDAKQGAYAEAQTLPGGFTLPVLAACGLIFSAATLTVILIVKTLLEKYGPSVD